MTGTLINMAVFGASAAGVGLYWRREYARIARASRERVARMHVVSRERMARRHPAVGSEPPRGEPVPASRSA